MSDHCRDCGAEISLGGVHCDRCAQPADDCADAQSQPARNRLPASTSPLAGNGLPARAPDIEAAFNEPSLWSGGYSPRAVMPAWFAAASMTLLAGTASLPFAGVGNALFVTLVVAVVSFGGVGLYWAYRRLSVRLDLTDERIVYQTGLFTRWTHEFPLIEIDDVAFGQGPIEWWFEVGTIKLILSDSTELLLPGIGNVHVVATKIDEAHHMACRRRGWFIDDAECGEASVDS